MSYVLLSSPSYIYRGGVNPSISIQHRKIRSFPFKRNRYCSVYIPLKFSNRYGISQEFHLDFLHCAALCEHIPRLSSPSPATDNTASNGFAANATDANTPKAGHASDSFNPENPASTHPSNPANYPASHAFYTSYIASA